MSHLFASDDQNTGASASASVLPMNIQSWSPFRLTRLISLLSKGLSGVFSSTTVLRCSAFMVQLLQPYLTTGKTIALTIQTFVDRVMSLLCNALPRFVIAFLPRSNHLLISWLQSPSAVILEPKKGKSVTTSTFSPSICMKWRERMPWSVFLILSFKPALSLSSFTFIKKLFSSSPLSAIRVVSSAYLRLLRNHLGFLKPTNSPFECG